MKIFFSIISIYFSLFSPIQQNSRPKPYEGWQPVCYLDSVEIDLSQTHFDPSKIASMNVLNSYIDSAKQIHGKILITSKDPGNYNFLTIHDIAKAYRQDTIAPVLFMLDNNFLKDISKVKIDSSYILSVECLHGDEFEYLKSTLTNLTILKIMTRRKFNLDKQKEIMIR